MRSAGFQRLRRASASSTCTPRLLPSSSCHSSTITSAQRRELLARLGLREHEREALGRRHERAWEACLACLARSAAGVSPVRRPDGPGKRPSPSTAFASELHRVAGEGAHRRDPEHAKRRRLLRALLDRLRHGAQERGERLARAGRRMHEPRFAGEVGRQTSRWKSKARQPLAANQRLEGRPRHRRRRRRPGDAVEDGRGARWAFDGLRSHDSTHVAAVDAPPCDRGA